MSSKKALYCQARVEISVAKKSRANMLCYPERWWMPHPWKHSRSGWMGLWATWSSWRCPYSWFYEHDRTSA